MVTINLHTETSLKEAKYEPDFDKGLLSFYESARQSQPESPSQVVRLQ